MFPMELLSFHVKVTYVSTVIKKRKKRKTEVRHHSYCDLAARLRIEAPTSDSPFSAPTTLLSGIHTQWWVHGREKTAETWERVKMHTKWRIGSKGREEKTFLKGDDTGL